MTSAQDVREMFKRFRILVVGRAHAGKTTLLQKVCNATEKPEVFDGRGNKIDVDVVRSSVDRGVHDINNELVFRSSPGFVFHDSIGFEAGGEDEFKEMEKFVSERASTRILAQRIHAIWYCIPMDEYHRAITMAEERFFSECDICNVPVVVVFTKFDALSAVAHGDLRKLPGLTRKDIYERTPKRVEEIFANANIWGRLCETRYPPKNCVRLAQMNIGETDCGPLLDCTTGALDDEALQMLLMSTQRSNLELCITFAVKRVLIPYVRRARQGSLQLSEDCITMQKEIAEWFPHTGLRDSKQQQELLDQLERQLLDRDEHNKMKEKLPENQTLYTMLLVPSCAPLESSGWALAHVIYIAIAAAIVLEYSFFLLQEGQQQPAEILELAASQYVESETPSIIKGTVDELLHQHHPESHDSEYGGGDEKLCKMIIDIILQRRMPLEV